MPHPTESKAFAAMFACLYPHAEQDSPPSKPTVRKMQYALDLDPSIADDIRSGSITTVADAVVKAERIAWMRMKEMSVTHPEIARLRERRSYKDAMLLASHLSRKEI